MGLPIEKPNVSPTGGYTTQQAAEVLGLSPHSIRRLIKTGEIRSYPRMKGNRCVYLVKGVEIVRFWRNRIMD